MIVTFSWYTGQDPTSQVIAIADDSYSITYVVARTTAYTSTQGRIKITKITEGGTSTDVSDWMLMYGEPANQVGTLSSQTVSAGDRLVISTYGTVAIAGGVSVYLS